MSDYLNPPSPPPPPPPPKGSGGWKIAGFACGGGCLVVLILIGVGLFFLRDVFKQAIGAAQEAQNCTPDMQRVWSALDNFQRANQGKYPDKLDELIPKYLPDTSQLACSKSPTVKFDYIKPRDNDPASASMLEGKFNITFQNATSSIILRVTKGGEVRIENSQGKVITPGASPAAGQ